MCISENPFSLTSNDEQLSTKTLKKETVSVLEGTNGFQKSYLISTNQTVFPAALSTFDVLDCVCSY